MSTRLEHGYRIAEPLSAALLDKLQRLRERAVPVVERLVARRVAKLAVLEIDQQRFGLSYGPTDALRNAWEKLEDSIREIESNRARLPEDDFSCTLSILVDPPEAETATLALIFTDQAELRRLWEGVPGVEEFAYWDHVDPPAEREGQALSEAEIESWLDRRHAWKRAIPTGIPVHHGFEFEVSSVFVPRPKPELVLESLPPPGERIAAVAGLLANREFFADWKATPRRARGPLPSIFGDEYRRLVERKTLDVAAAFQETVTLEELRGQTARGQTARGQTARGGTGRSEAAHSKTTSGSPAKDKGEADKADREPQPGEPRPKGPRP